MKVFFILSTLIVCPLISRILQAQEWIPKRIVGIPYPALAAQARIVGTIELQCIIDNDGSVNSTKVLSMSGPGPVVILAEACEENAKKWRFVQKDSTVTTGSPNVILKYTFILEGVTQARRYEEFVFEFPNSVFVTSEAPLAQP